jgi:dTDP-3-amino-2,3,6-trideoxy-4-keto-D-glucose/dTDP-3-amino-3,4,6-trideoxy-alpha-D-glucose/dTDP-2,6-dideoxy-D-kanosamine transaminase
MKIPFNYLPYQFNNTASYFKKWKKLIKSTQFTLGPFIKEFEKNFAKYIKAKHCISTNNGTDALILALKSLGIKKDDEVITVCNSFYATAGAIVACGAKPVFVDSDDRYQIKVDDIKKFITKKTKVILPVHWGGASPDMTKINKIAKKYNLRVVEDACMGIGASIKKKSPGTFGDISAMSMHPLKSLNVMGDGGMVVTNNDKLASWARKYRNHGMRDRDRIDYWGVNMRLQPLQAIVAGIELKKVKNIIKLRNKNAKFFDQQLSKLDEVIIPKRESDHLETFALYMARFKNRNKLKSYLIKNGVEVKVHYPIPLHLQKAAKYLKYKRGDFPIAEIQASELITLPVHQYLKKKELLYIVKKIKDFYKKN